METRSETIKRAREPHQDSKQEYVVENCYKVPRLSNNDKAFFKELIKESEFYTAQAFKKAIKESEEFTLSVIKNSIKESEEKHFGFIKNLLKECEEKILSVLEVKINDLNTKIDAVTERVEKLEMKSVQTNDMKEILELKRKINKQENSVVAGSIRISGVPFYENENLYNIFKNICDNIQIQTPKINNIYRLTKIYKDNKPSNPKDEVIIVKLSSPFEKNFLLKSIAKYRRANRVNLSLRQAGFESQESIYVNEDLTPHNHKIFKAALNLKKKTTKT